MEYYTDKIIETINEMRDENYKLSVRNDSLEEEISYLRGMVRWLIEHLSTKVTLDEMCKIESMKEDLEYFKEKNYDIEEEHEYK